MTSHQTHQNGLRLSIAFALALSASAAAWSQSDKPASDRTPAEPTAAQQAPARIGDATRALLAAQADDSIAGAPLPMLGATGNASWQRYLDSFKHPIPEFFENKVQVKTGGGS